MKLLFLCSLLVGGIEVSAFAATGKVDWPPIVSGSATEDKVLRTRKTGDGAKCTPGSRWRVDCNWCTCNELGFGVCSHKECPPGEELNEPICEGNSSWNDDCNRCVCVGNGLAACSLVECFHGKVDWPPIVSGSATEDKVLRARKTGDGAKCTAGSRWRVDCNWCTCNERGFGVCSHKECPPGEELNEPFCERNSHWKDDCNWCFCVGNGLAACTKMGCNSGRF